MFEMRSRSCCSHEAPGGSSRCSRSAISPDSAWFLSRPCGTTMSWDCSNLRGMLRLKQVEVEGRIGEARAQLARVEARLRQIEKEGEFPMYEVVLKKLPVQNVAAIGKTLLNCQWT